MVGLSSPAGIWNAAGKKACKPHEFGQVRSLHRRRVVALVCFILFLIPGFPKAALCYIIGLSRMNIRKFIVVSTIGRLFGTILLSLTGDMSEP